MIKSMLTFFIKKYNEGDIMKNKILLLFNYLLSLYVLISVSFFYSRYVSIVNENFNIESDLMFFIKDNYIVIGFFLLFLFIILMNLFYIVEYWIFREKESLFIKKIVGYHQRELTKEYYLSYMSLFIVVLMIAFITIIPALLYFKLPVVIPLILSLVFMLIVKSVFIIYLIKRYLIKNEYSNDRSFELKKLAFITIQFSLSLLLIFVSLHLFTTINRQLSPYENYVKLENSWIIRMDTEAKPISFWIEAEREPELYFGEIVEELKEIYTKYEDNVVVYSHSSYYTKDIGIVILMNERAMKLNNLNFDFPETENVPVILGSRYLGQYKVGDIIPGNDIVDGGKTEDYVVMKVLTPSEDILILGPYAAVEDSTQDFSIALFKPENVSNYLTVRNADFINSVFLINLPESVIQGITDSLSTKDISFSYASIKEEQVSNHNGMLILLSTYFLIGSVNLLFSFIGLICVVYMDIQSKKVYFSILKLVGYTNKHIYFKYLSFLVFIFIPAYLIGLTLYVTTLGFTVLTASIVALIVLVLLIIVSLISISIIKKINSVAIIGGENV